MNVGGVCRDSTGARLRWSAVLVLTPLCALAAAQTERPGHLNAAGYRESHYRAPTPDSVPHGIRVNTRALRRLIAQRRPVLIDVQAVTVRPETAQFGISWLPSAPRYHIPGSVWLPNVGYGSLDAAMDRYFRTNLASVTGGDLESRIVFYCVVDCWMSWNAVQRAAGYGYANLYWYPQGTEGWAARGLPLVEAEPVPLEFINDKARIGGSTKSHN